MAPEHLAIVWNPAKTTEEDLRNALDTALARERIEAEVSWFETSVDDPGREAADRAIAAGADVVVAAGGDGTVRLVAERVSEEDDVDLAIAPLGTGNLLARNLGVPIGDLDAAFARALTGSARSIDLGVATVDGMDHAFAVMAGFGIDAHMITETGDDLKDRAGWLAYVESLGRAVSASDVIGIRLTDGDESPVDTQAHTVLIGNCGAVQGGITLLPAADPADGELDLLVLDAAGLGGWLDTMRNMLWDNGLKKLLPGAEAGAESSSSALHRRVTRLAIDLEEPREVEIDGDTIGEAMRIEIGVRPGALRVR